MQRKQTERREIILMEKRCTQDKPYTERGHNEEEKGDTGEKTCGKKTKLTKTREEARPDVEPASI